MVSTHLKNISQNGNLPQVGIKIKNVWNHHPNNNRNNPPTLPTFCLATGCWPNFSSLRSPEWAKGPPLGCRTTSGHPGDVETRWARQWGRVGGRVLDKKCQKNKSKWLACCIWRANLPSLKLTACPWRWWFQIGISGRPLFSGRLLLVSGSVSLDELKWRCL